MKNSIQGLKRYINQMEITPKFWSLMGSISCRLKGIASHDINNHNDSSNHARCHQPRTKPATTSGHDANNTWYKQEYYEFLEISISRLLQSCFLYWLNLATESKATSFPICDPDRLTLRDKSYNRLSDLIGDWFICWCRAQFYHRK